MNNLELERKFTKISVLLKKCLPLLSQNDIHAISGDRFEHKWISSLTSLSLEDLVRFDAGREHRLLDDPEWLQMIDELKELDTFKLSNKNDAGAELKAFGNVKKQHELKQLYSFLDEDKGKSVVDFGGGVGHLASFLEQNLFMDVTVLEQNQELVEKGKAKLLKLNSKVTFEHCHIHKNEVTPNILSSDLAIGLHTCGNFATDMFRVCLENKTKKIINFGCCYSKIKSHDYNLSSGSDKSIVFNPRALLSATQAFHSIPTDFYDYRENIVKHKFSFLHWLFKEHGNLDFFSMSNSRKSLYENTFSDYLEICLAKYFPELPLPDKTGTNLFYESSENIELLNYISVIYAIRRYLGQLVELYLLCDRALYLNEKGYAVEIVEVFDPSISPRCRAIVATSDGT
jgi:hypothetical protein